MTCPSCILQGARYIYTDKVSDEEEYDSANHTSQIYQYVRRRGRFAPNSSSLLFQKLCARPSPSEPCAFPREVVLDQNLDCRSEQECGSDTIRVVQIRDGGKIRYYKYQSVPCVRLLMFNGGRATKWQRNLQCAEPTAPVAGTACCNVNGNSPSATPSYLTQSGTERQCLFTNEHMKLSTAKERCAALGGKICDNGFYIGGAYWEFSRMCSFGQYSWTDVPCSLQVQVDREGLVNLVQPEINLPYQHNREKGKFRYPANQVLGSQNKFAVPWKDEIYPGSSASSTCTGLCAPAAGGSCLCNVTVAVTQVFSGSQVPSLADVRANLFIGAADPSTYGSGNEYAKCTQVLCTNSGMEIYVKGGSGAFSLAKDTIFKVPPFRAGGRSTYVFNKKSTVMVGDSYEFRNPPHFMPLAGETYTEASSKSGNPNTITRLGHEAAELEVDALLEHLFEHQNTPAFVADKTITRMVTSNPSPRYVKAAADGFRTGTCPGSGLTFSGKYGDLGAMLCVILTDPEARSLTIAADPTYGRLREPLLKVVHLMRALEYTPNSDSRSETLLKGMHDRIGQEVRLMP